MANSGLHKRGWIGVILGCVVAALAVASAAALQQNGDASYLPLAIGNRWELRSRSAPDPMVLEVTGRDGDAFLLRWVNPWLPGAVFRFVMQGQEVHMTGLDTGSGMAPIPPETVYWDFGRRNGERWNSPVGRQRVSERGARVTTPAGNYPDSVEIETIDQKNQSMFWTFARGVGLVRWGRGRDAYLLTSFREGRETTRTAPTPRAPAAPPRAAASGGGGPLLVGLDTNPWSGANDRQALEAAYEAGLSIVHIIPTWRNFETGDRRYEYREVDPRAAFAAERNIPASINLRVVDTNNKSLPRDIGNARFDEDRVADRLVAALRALRARVKGPVRVIAVGNEIDAYFSSRRNEIAAYTQLVRRVRDTAKELFPDALFTVNFSYSHIGDLDQYRSITDLIDAYSFTYYPLNADFTMRSPDVVGAEIDRMMSAAGGKPVYFQEIGYASAAQLNSSPARQAQFVENVFAALRRHRSQVVGGTFLFMSDLSRVTVELLGIYYGSQSGNFKAYLETLGLRERDGTPKPAWDMWRREALAVRQAR